MKGRGVNGGVWDSGGARGALAPSGAVVPLEVERHLLGEHDLRGAPGVKCGGGRREGRGVCFLNSAYVRRTSKSYKGGVYSLESLLYASKLPILEGACTLKAA